MEKAGEQISLSIHVCLKHGLNLESMHQAYGRTMYNKGNEHKFITMHALYSFLYFWLKIKWNEAHVDFDCNSTYFKERKREWKPGGDINFRIQLMDVRMAYFIFLFHITSINYFVTYFLCRQLVVMRNLYDAIQYFLRSELLHCSHSLFPQFVHFLIFFSRIPLLCREKQRQSNNAYIVSTFLRLWIACLRAGIILLKWTRSFFSSQCIRRSQRWWIMSNDNEWSTDFIHLLVPDFSFGTFHKKNNRFKHINFD